MGIDHDISFTRPVLVDIHIRADITYDPAVYVPATDDQLVKDTLKALGDSYAYGETLVYERFQAELFSIPGVVDSTLFYLDRDSPGTGMVNIPFAITDRELPTFDTADIDVNSSAA